MTISLRSTTSRAEAAPLAPARTRPVDVNALLAGLAMDSTRFDVRFGLVGFRDTTLAQPLELPLLGGERMSTDVTRLIAEVHRLG